MTNRHPARIGWRFFFDLSKDWLTDDKGDRKMDIGYLAMPTQIANAYRAGGLDANGIKPERTLSDGDGNPCRHCLTDIEKGRPMLILAHRPFENLNPYSEIGPVFLCADPCQRHDPANTMPAVLKVRPAHLVRAYDKAEQILGGTGGIVSTHVLQQRLETLLSDGRAQFAHVRSATNSCYTCRVERI
jgi:hypothetical protein